MESNQNTNKPDELDVVNLLEKLFSFVRNYGMLLLVFSLIGLAFGLFRYFSSPKQYASRLILHSAVLTNQEEIEIVDSWKELLSKGEYPTLAGIMKCDINVVKQLTGISAEEIQKVYSQNNPNGFIIDVMVKDTSILDELQSGILRGLGGSTYVSERVESRRARFSDLIQKVKIEIAKLDATKNLVDSMIRSHSNNSTPLLVDVSNINSEWIALNEKLISYQEDLKFVNAVQVLQGFTKFGKPSSPGLLRSSIFGLAAGFFIGYIISLFKYVQSRMKQTRK